jgi:hypothetical protein
MDDEDDGCEVEREESGLPRNEVKDEQIAARDCVKASQPMSRGHRFR